MRAQGTLYLSRTPALATTAADGTWQLTLLLMDRIGPNRVEPWRVTWPGPEARAWWQAHQQALQPGQPLAVQLTAIRSFTVGRSGGAEMHARVLACELAPRAGNTPDSRPGCTEQPPQAVPAEP